ncbi:HD domain-containing phosphohydrolase [Paenibacillus sp. yr247]|uniref:HD-GYP domain-containing protein n=1 Tax=Paenibacillus sp. yr247 TaxID=1761880 RepID=UPI0011404E67
MPYSSFSDGGGYPDGLKGLDIPDFGRIIAVADAFDAMTSDRPYRKGMAIEKAMAILAEGKGSQ